MEIIKEIKTAEKEAKQIIENAQKKAASELDKAKKERAEKLEKRRLERRAIVDKAVEKATTEANAQVNAIESQTRKSCDEIAGKNDKSIKKSVDEVLDFINKLAE